MKIYIGSDHAGYEMKEKLIEYLAGLELGYEIVDKGAFEYKEDDDYPDFVFPVALAVAGEPQSFGIVLGGSGQGEAMCANKVVGARAAVFYGQEEPDVDDGGLRKSDTFEIVKLSREHNDANILALGARFVTVDEAKFAIELFLNTKFSGDERHKRRLIKLEPK
jgi:ribose 5-phosphate isomerase B